MRGVNIVTGVPAAIPAKLPLADPSVTIWVTPELENVICVAAVRSELLAT